MRAIGKSSDLILNLCQEVGATRYISGIGGRNYLKEVDFDNAGIEILYKSPILPEDYPQPFELFDFIGNLSAIDILFNCGSSWRDYLPRKGD